MNSFTINFLRLLRNSTAMTLLFLPAVFAMQSEKEDLKASSSTASKPRTSASRVAASSELIFGASTSGAAASSELTSGASASGTAASSSMGFGEIDEERMAIKLRNFFNFEEPQKLFLLNGRRFIKGEVPGDGTCFLHTLNILFPDRGISRERFATLLGSAFRGENSIVSPEELRKEFAAELYTQLYQYKVGGGALEFQGDEIRKLSASLLNKAYNYLEIPANINKIMQDIATNDKIIEEMLDSFAKTFVYLSLPSVELGNIGSFGLACKLFGLNLDIYSPINDEPSSLYKRQEFRSGNASLPPKSALYADAHVSPLCLADENETRKRFAVNEINEFMQTYGITPQDMERILQASPSLFTKSEIRTVFDQPYTIGRFNVDNIDQYGIQMPQAPTVFSSDVNKWDSDWKKNFGAPIFSYAARHSSKDLDLKFFPPFLEAEKILQKLGIAPEAADFFYVVQDNPWGDQAPLFLRPQSWVLPETPLSSDMPYDKGPEIRLAISSPNNSITFTGTSKGVISSHNGKDPVIDPIVVSPGESFPMLSGLKADQTSFFLSTVVSDTGRAAVTFHAILNEDNFDELQETTINNLRDLQYWLLDLLHSKYQDNSDFFPQSTSSLFTKKTVDFFGQKYTTGRSIENTEQYRIDMPQAPVVHTYNMEQNVRKNFGTPIFSYAAQQDERELDPNLFPAFSEVQANLRKLGIDDPKMVDYFYVVQDDPWMDKIERLLRPQSWVFPDAPYSSNKPYSVSSTIKVAISSPNNSIVLAGSSEGSISSHNGITSTGSGSPIVISSGGSFPMLSGLTADQTSFFVSTVAIPSTKRAAVTFHTILSDDDLAQLQAARINNLRDLQLWLAVLFQSKYGAELDSSSPYSKWTTGAAAPVRLNPHSFTIVRDDIKGRGLTTPFSFRPTQEGSFEISGEGTLFYQLLPKPLMDMYVGQKLLLEAEIKSETPGGYLQYFNGNERVMSDPYPGGNGWQKLQLEFTVKSDSRCHIIYPLVMPPKAPGSKIPVIEVKSIKVEPRVEQQRIHPSLELNPGSFAIVRDDIKGRGLTTPFSFKPTQEGLFEVTGEGTLFYQLLPKPLMDTYLGQKFLLEAEIKSETPGGYLQYFNGNERVMSDPYPGGNGWQKLQLEFTVKSDSRYHIVYPLVMPPKAPGSKVPVVEIRNIKLEPYNS